MTTKTELTKKEQSELLLNLLLDHFSSEYDIIADDMEDYDDCWELGSAHVWVSAPTDSVTIEPSEETGGFSVVFVNEDANGDEDLFEYSLNVSDALEITTDMLANAIDAAIAEGRYIY